MRIQYISIISVILILFGSCTRDYFCECTYEYSGSGSPPNAKEITTIHSTKSRAKKSCESKSETFIDENTKDSTVVICELF